MISSGFCRAVDVAASFGLAAAGVVVLSPLAGAASQPQLKLGLVPRGVQTYAACPHNDRQQLISTATGSRATLVPPGARQVLLCRYRGLNPSLAAAFRLVAQRLIGRRQPVARLTGEFDALKPFQSGSFACPADFGVKIVAIFRYLPTPRSDDPVTLDPNGCASVSNGHLVRTAMLPPGSALVAQLEALTAPGS